MKTLILLGIAILSAGCGPIGKVTDEDVTKNLHYFQDKRAHLCYAYWKGGAITAVPCEQVTALIENGWSR